MRYILLYIILMIQLMADSSKLYQVKDEDISGPPEMFNITALCDAEKLKKIEATLSGDEVVPIKYNYAIMLFFKEHKINTSHISGNGFDDKPFSDSVKECIIKGFIDSVKFEYPEKGMILLTIKFPAFVTKKNDDSIYPEMEKITLP